jgi:hypothetical protein
LNAADPSAGKGNGLMAPTGGGRGCSVCEHSSSCMIIVVIVTNVSTAGSSSCCVGFLY